MSRDKTLFLTKLFIWSKHLGTLESQWMLIWTKIYSFLSITMYTECVRWVSALLWGFWRNRVAQGVVWDTFVSYTTAFLNNFSPNISQSKPKKYFSILNSLLRIWLNIVVDQKLSTLMFFNKYPFACVPFVSLKKPEAKKYAILLR